MPGSIKIWPKKKYDIYYKADQQNVFHMTIYKIIRNMSFSVVLQRHLTRSVR